MWKTPPISKVYEGLGAVADERLEIAGNTAKCYSSSGNKFYDIEYDGEQGAIMCNDNASYWKGYLGYPAIAFLLQTGMLPYDAALGELMKGIAWKDINQRYKNDFDAALAEILSALEQGDRAHLATYTADLLRQIEGLGLKKLGKRKLPPKGY